MNQHWHKQQPETPLFPDIAWNKPERRDQSGRLGIIGGNKFGFVAAAEAYETACQNGVGEVRVLLPDALRSKVPPQMTDVLFAPTNPSGGLASEATHDISALNDWATGLLLIGDAGKNSQTAIVYEKVTVKADKPIILTRDAIDLVQNSFSAILDNPNVTLVASFAQIQRIFRTVYYPKVLTFNMQLAQFVDVMHKFTVTYPSTVAVLHADHMVIAHGGEVATQPWQNAMKIWRGETATKAASYLLWTPTTPLEAVATSLIG